MKLIEPRRGVQTKEKVIDMFTGFNNTENASEKQFSHTKNLSGDDFPSVVPRKSRSLHSTLTTPNGVLSFNDSLYTVDGTQLKKDGVVKGSVTNSKKCLLEFNGYILIFPDKTYYDTLSNTYGTFASGNPDIDKATVHNNRVFGIKGNQIYASKQGDFKLWNTFEQLNTDSWATDVAGSVKFNTIGAYQNHVVIQSSVNMFELYGYKPSNFQVQETSKVGSNVFSYVEANSILFFANEDGIYQFTGGVPRKISEGISYKIQSAELGTDGKCVFASTYDGNNRHLFKYNTETQLMYREDDLNVVQFTKHGGKLHALCADGKLMIFNSGTEVIDWEFETIELRDGVFEKAALKQLVFHAQMSVSSIMNVFIKGDSDHDYTLVKTLVAETERTAQIPVILNQNCYKIKVSGRGYVKLIGIKRIMQKGGAV